MLLRSDKVTSVPTPTIPISTSISWLSSPSTLPPAAEAQGPGTTKTPPHCWHSPGTERRLAENRDMPSCRSGQDPSPKSFCQPGRGDRTLCCACPSAPALSHCPPHPTTTPPWPHHPLLSTSSFPLQPKQAGTSPAEPMATPAGGQSTDPPRASTQDSGWQGLHAAAARVGMVN